MVGFGLVELFLMGLLGVGVPGATSLSHANPMLALVAAPARLLAPAAGWFVFGRSVAMSAVAATMPPPPPPQAATATPIPVLPARPAVPARPAPPVLPTPTP